MKKSKIISSLVSATSIGCFVLPMLTSCSKPSIDIASIKYKALPSVRIYETQNKTWEINKNTRFFIDDKIPQKFLQEVIEKTQMINAEYAVKKIGDEMPLQICLGDLSKSVKNDISITIDENVGKDIEEEIFSEIQRNQLNEKCLDELYQIDINNGAKIKARNPIGVLWALRTLQQIQTAAGALAHGKIIDWPKTSERTMTIDAADRNYEIEWAQRLIKDMSYIKMNTFQFQFLAEGMLFESESHPSLNNHRKYESWQKWQFKNLADFAKLNGVNLIPTFNAPGHCSQIVKAINQELNSSVILNDGFTPYDAWNANYVSPIELADGTSAFDIAMWATEVDQSPDISIDNYDRGNLTKREMSLDLSDPAIYGSLTKYEIATNFIKDIIDEFVPWFLQLGIFEMGIGSDEFVAWEDPWPSYPKDLKFWQYKYTNEIVNYIKTNYPQMQIRGWHDTYYRIDNQGFPEGTPNDVTIRGDVYPEPRIDNISANDHLPINPDLNICYWSKRRMQVSTVERFIDYGHSLVNFNDDYLYYVPEEAQYDPHANSKTIFDPNNGWHPGKFPHIYDPQWPERPIGDQEWFDNNSKYDEYDLSILPMKGASVSVWAPYDRWMEENHYFYYLLRSFNQKCWNGSQPTVSYNEFMIKTVDKLDRPAGYDRELPNPSPIIFIE